MSITNVILFQYKVIETGYQNSFILLRGGKWGGLTSKVLTLEKGVGGSVNILTAVRH